jgi:hypothetical protein
VSLEADKEVVGASAGYTFTKKAMGGALNMKVKKPEPVFDYSFKILPVGRFADSNALPSGLVYQIELFTIPTHATVKQIKGVSPVFEKLSPSLKYTYYAGLFKTYKDALSNLNKVKKLGFKSASIVAFENEKQVSVAQARSGEAKSVKNYYLRIYPDDGQTLPDLAATVIRQQCDKDLVRLVEGGKAVYVVGPFDEESDIQPVITALKATNVTNVSVTSADRDVK